MNEKITFADLVNKIVEETGASKKLVHDLLIELGHVTMEGLNQDGHVHFPGLGWFRLKWHAARPGRNPQTGEEIEIPAQSSIHFKADADLRAYINRNYAHLKPEFFEGEVEPTEEEEVGVTAAVEEPYVEPVPAIPAVEREEEKRKSFKWLWLIIPLIIIVLAILFWPAQRETLTDVEEPVVAEKTDEEVPQQPEATEQPEEEPTADVGTSGTPGGQHTVRAGEKLWTISQDFYDRGKLWPNIYRVNSDDIPNPDYLSVGDDIQVPPLQGKPDQLTRKDREEIAEGFMEAYLFYRKTDRIKALSYLWVVKKWNMDVVITRYNDRIEAGDLVTVQSIDGVPRLE